jgi:type I restriction enzyme S subunit
MSNPQHSPEAKRKSQDLQCTGSITATDEGRSVRATGQLPQGWTMTRVSQSIRIIDYRGRTPPFAESGIPHLRSSNVRDGRIVWSGLAYVTEAAFVEFMTRGLPEDGDVLFTTEAPMGEVAMAPVERFSLAQRLMILRPSREVFVPRFLMFQLMSPQFQSRLRYRGTGSTVTGVSSRNFRPLQLVVAPLADQHRIVAEIEKQFTRLDAGVASLKRVQIALKRYRASVLKAACEGRLVPTEAELARRERRSYETGEQLLAHILDERRVQWGSAQLEKLKASGKKPVQDQWKAKYSEPDPPQLVGYLANEIPLGWTLATVKQLSSVVQYGTSAKTSGNADGIPVLRMGNINDGSLDLEQLKYLPGSHDEFPDLLLEARDILFNGQTVRNLSEKLRYIAEIRRRVRSPPI